MLFGGVCGEVLETVDTCGNPIFIVDAGPGVSHQRKDAITALHGRSPSSIGPQGPLFGDFVKNSTSGPERANSRCLSVCRSPCDGTGFIVDLRI